MGCLLNRSPSYRSRMDAEDKRALQTLVRSNWLGDWSLNRVLLLGVLGLSPSMTLLVGGQWIEGELARPEEWADKLDGDLDRGLQGLIERLEHAQGPVADISQIQPGISTPGDVEHLRAQLREGSFRSFTNDYRELFNAIAERLKAVDEDEELSDELADKAAQLDDPIDVITLRDVVVRGAVPRNDRHLPFLRVLRAHVAAWYLGRTTTAGG
jgi:hypothetical protein